MTAQGKESLAQWVDYWKRQGMTPSVARLKAGKSFGSAAWRKIYPSKTLPRDYWGTSRYSNLV